MCSIARCMAPSGLKKALSFEAVRLATQERVQQRPPPERRFGEGPNLAAHRGPDCAGDGGAVGGSAEDDVSHRNSATDCRADRRPYGANLCKDQGAERGYQSGQDRNLQRTVEQLILDHMGDAISQRYVKLLRNEIRKNVNRARLSKLLRTQAKAGSCSVQWCRAQNLVHGECRGGQKYLSGAR